LQIFFFGCESSSKSSFIYPSQEIIEIRYLCNLPFFDETSRHLQWKDSKPSLLFINKDKVLVFFENNHVYKIKKKIDFSLASGKYPCDL